MAEWWDPETRRAIERIGLNVKLARVERGLNQEDIALETGMARSHVSQLERGIVAPSVHSILRLSKALRVPPSELLRDIELR
jgi:transcriptional regulator with XRE-family HTH domain